MTENQPTVSKKIVQRDFFKCFKSLRCLWDPTHENFRNKIERQKAYQILVQKYLPLDKYATIDTVKRKLDTYKRDMRREYKKMEHDSSYIPKLWYYRYLSFLNDSYIKSNYHMEENQDKEELISSNNTILDKNDKREVLKTFFKAYRASPCLWDKSHKLYTSRIARESEYKELLKIYSRIDSSVGINEIKRKIDQYRVSFHREYRLVVASNFQRVPLLWYYKYLKFLNKRNKNEHIQCSNIDNEDEVTEYNTIYQNIQMQNIITDSIYILETDDENASTDFDVQEHIENEDPEQDINDETVKESLDREYLNVDQESSYIDKDSLSTEEEISTDNTDGLSLLYKLKSLDPSQRCIAEKLIKETISLGRLGELTSDSYVCKRKKNNNCRLDEIT